MGSLVLTNILLVVVAALLVVVAALLVWIGLLGSLYSGHQGDTAEVVYELREIRESIRTNFKSLMSK